jgi:membrane-bound lytic murein transglycosylase D
LTIPSGAAEAIVTRATTLRSDDATVAICSYTLREGDNIRRLARAIGTTVDTILAMNDRQSTNEIHRGEAIYLPVRARELGSLLVDAQTYYAVKKGDTIYSIARRHKLTVQELRELNQLSPRHKLHAGEKLRVATPRALSAGGM